MRRFDIRWTNFRSLEDTGWIDIRPITLVIGANASGKTSLIAPLLILKQTLESADSSLPLRTEGRYFNAGSFRNLIRDHALSRDLGFAIRFRQPHGTPKELLPVPAYPPGSLSVAFSQPSDHAAIDLRRYSVADTHGREMVSRELHDDGKYSLLIASAPTSDADFEAAVTKLGPDHFLFTLEAFFAARYKQVSRGATRPPRMPKPIDVKVGSDEQAYITTIALTASAIAHVLNPLTYIGPLREAPHRLYDITGESPSGVGSRGQFAPEILFRNRDAKLMESVNRWVGEFGFGFSLKARSYARGRAFDLVVRRKESSPWVNVADTGFGLSQVLPLIVQGYYADSDSLIIAEQPEIHLNPRLQSKLADLFAGIASRGVGVLVETHSEHLVLRLRRLIAEGSVHAKDVAIYFVDRTDDKSTIREIPVRPDGHIDAQDWPKGFFDDSLKEALGLAAAQSRAQHA